MKRQTVRQRSAIIHRLPIKARLVCSTCGASGEGTCGCGAPYVPAGERAAAAIAANPAQSDRAIAEEIGVSDKTVGKARKSTAEYSAVERRTGKDGKTRKLPRFPRMPPVRTDVQEFTKQIGAFMNEFSERLQAWHRSNPAIDDEARHALVHSLSTYSMQLQILAQLIDGREEENETD